MLYVQLDANWPDNHKIIEAGIDGAGAHAIILCLAKRLDEDGWVRRSLLRRHDIGPELIDRLVGLCLLEGDEVRVRAWGWHERNLSADEIAAKKTDNAKKANHSKWNHAGAYAECGRCHPAPPSAADPVGVQADPPVSLESEVEPESEPSPRTELDRIVDEVFTRCLADKQRRGEAIHTVEGYRQWWDANESEGCRKRAAWFLEHYTMPSLGHYADATRSPSVPRWAGSMLKVRA